jgi:enoyl-CoA hydratase
MIYRTLSYEKTGFIGLISIGGRDYRGLTPQLTGELGEVCSGISWDEDARVVVLVCDGEIVEPADEGCDESSGTEPASLVDPIARLKQPTIGAIRGNAIGLGLELAMACDIRIGTEGAHFGLPRIRDGFIPCAGGTQRLPRLVGRGKALEMLLTGDSVDASEALRIGLMNRIVPSHQLAEQAIRMGEEMAEKSPLAVTCVKEALYGGTDLTLDQGLRMELDLYLLLFSTRDRVEGVTAFREKRKAKFDGE